MTGRNAKKLIALGNRARIFLAEESVAQVFLDLEQDIFILWSKTKSEQAETREELYREMHGVRALKKRLKKYVDDSTKIQEAMKNESS